MGKQTRVMLVHPGVNWSVQDWFDGLGTGLSASNVEIDVYDLFKYLRVAETWLAQQWTELAADRAEAGEPEPAKPTTADVYYRASSFVLERALRTMPEYIVVIAGIYFHPDFVLMLRRAGFKVVMVLTESPYDDLQQLPIARWAWAATTNERTSVAPLQAATGRALYMPAGFLPTRHNPLAQENDLEALAHDVVFVGTQWEERAALFNALAEREDMRGVDVGIYGFGDVADSPMAQAGWVKGSVIRNAMTTSLYRRAKIGVNLHRASKTAESTNNRVYELAACGVFFLSDARAEVVELFGDLVPTFSTAEELAALIQHWLPREQERIEIGRELARRAESHTWAERARTLMAFLQEG